MDQIDRLSGLNPDSELYAVRRERPEFVEGVELCRETVLAPEHGFGLSHALRAALAARMARLIGRQDLASAYDKKLEEAGSEVCLTAIASAAEVAADADASVRALVRHVDLVTESPRNSTKADIEKLAAAGLSNSEIVALSELIAFVNFEARIIVGLEMLEQVA
jgi:uncharacterized protein YciW